MVTPRTTICWPTMTRATSRSRASAVWRTRSTAAAGSIAIAMRKKCLQGSRVPDGSSEVAAYDGALLAGDQVLLGCDLTRLLCLRRFVDGARGHARIGGDLILGPVSRALARP